MKVWMLSRMYLLYQFLQGILAQMWLKQLTEF